MASTSTEHVSATAGTDADGIFPGIRKGFVYRVEERLGLTRADNSHVGLRVILAIALTWLPLIVLALFSGGSRACIELLKNYRVLARFVIAIPIFIISQQAITIRFEYAIRQLSMTHIVRDSELPQFKRILTRTRTLANTAVPQLVVLMVYFAFALMDRHRFASPGLWAIQTATGPSLFSTKAGWYFLLVSEPIYLMMVTVIIWKWMVWVSLLWRVSQLDLQLAFAHPDRCGGLGFLEYVPEGYTGPVFGVCALIGAGWQFNVANHYATLASYSIPVSVLLVGILLLMFGPLAFFSSRLVQLRRTGLFQYGMLAHLQAAHFNQKWITDLESNEPQLPSVPEVSALHDLGEEFQQMMSTRSVPLHRSSVVEMTVVVLIPMLPMLITVIPLMTLLKDIARALL